MAEWRASGLTSEAFSADRGFARRAVFGSGRTVLRQDAEAMRVARPVVRMARVVRVGSSPVPVPASDVPILVEVGRGKAGSRCARGSIARRSGRCSTCSAAEVRDDSPRRRGVRRARAHRSPLGLRAVVGASQTSVSDGTRGAARALRLFRQATRRHQSPVLRRLRTLAVILQAPTTSPPFGCPRPRATRRASRSRSARWTICSTGIDVEVKAPPRRPPRACTDGASSFFGAGDRQRDRGWISMLARWASKRRRPGPTPTLHFASRVVELETQLAAVTKERDQPPSPHAVARRARALEAPYLRRKSRARRHRAASEIAEFADKLRQLDALAGELPDAPGLTRATTRRGRRSRPAAAT